MEQTIGQETIRNIIKKLFHAIAVPKNIFAPVIDGLVETSLRGIDSHGIRLAPHYLRAAVLGRINTNPKLKFKKTSSSTEILDADHTFGITAGTAGMKKAIGMGRENGTGIVVVKNSSHFGAAGIYGLMAARNNMIGISMTNVEDLVVPYGGKKPFLGTNAFCFAAPMADEEPFILDMATASMSLNKLRMHQKEKKPIEKGWGIDKNGRYITNPNKVTALTHFGGYKGYGLALMVEILCGLLSGGPYGPKITHMFPLNEKKRKLSHFFMAIDLKRFQPVSLFKKRLKKLADWLRVMEPAEGFGKVMVAGDPEKEIYRKRIKKGIPFTDEIRQSYEDLGKELGISINWKNNL